MAAKKKRDDDEANQKRRVLLAAINRLMTTEYATYSECEEATGQVTKLLKAARREGLLVGGGKRKPLLPDPVIEIRVGEFSQRSTVSPHTYDRLATLMHEREGWSLVRMFEVGLTAIAAAESGDSTALSLTRQEDLRANQQARRKSRAPRAKARKRS